MEFILNKIKTEGYPVDGLVLCSDWTVLFHPDYPYKEEVESLVALNKDEAEIAGIVKTKVTEIQAEKCRVRDKGFEVNGVLFDSDQTARTSYLELLYKFQTDPSFSTKWKASDRVWVDMNLTLFTQVQAVGNSHMQMVFSWQEAKEREISTILESLLPLEEKKEALRNIKTSFQIGE